MHSAWGSWTFQKGSQSPQTLGIAFSLKLPQSLSSDQKGSLLRNRANSTHLPINFSKFFFNFIFFTSPLTILQSSSFALKDIFRGHSDTSRASRPPAALLNRASSVQPTGLTVLGGHRKMGNRKVFRRNSEDRILPLSPQKWSKQACVTPIEWLNWILKSFTSRDSRASLYNLFLYNLFQCLSTPALTFPFNLSHLCCSLGPLFLPPSITDTASRLFPATKTCLSENCFSHLP